MRVNLLRFFIHFKFSCLGVSGRRFWSDDGSVTLGMWSLLYNELNDLAAKSKEAERGATKYVLPEIAEQYLKNRLFGSWGTVPFR